MFRRNKRLAQGIAHYLMAAMIVMPVQTQAESGTSKEMSQIGRSGQSFALDVGTSFRDNMPTGSSSNITIPTLKDGKFGPGTETINTNDLNPMTSTTGSGSAQYFPDGLQPNVGELEGIFDDEGGMGQLGSASKKSLFEDANSENPSYVGSAYNMMLDLHSMEKPDLSNDPIFNTAKDIYENLDVIAEGFADCSIDQQFTETENVVHVPDYKRCTKVVDRTTQCEVLHSFEAEVIKHYSGPFNLKNCGLGCTQMWIGRVGDNYWSGRCSIYQEQTTVMVINPKAVTKAVLEYAKWDDYMQVWIGPPGKEQLVWGGPYGTGTFPPETSGRCELSTSWAKNPNVDITKYFSEAKEGEIINFKIRVSVTGGGEGYGRVRISYDPDKAISNDVWAPEECIEAAQGIYDGFAEGSVRCLENGADANGCVVMNGIQVCEPNLKPSPFPNIPNTCRKVAVNADYNFNQGQGSCWTDAQGNKVCIENEGGNNNTCKELEANPECGYISSECVEGAEGSSGTCYVQKDTYDCGTTIKVPSIESETEYKCAGEIACLGSDCLELTKEESKDFAEAAALLNVAQFATQDMECVDSDGTENVTCTVFSGNPAECKIAVGGMQDCCESPEGISLNDYITLLMATSKLDAAAMAVDPKNANMVVGAYQNLATPIHQTFTEITKPFTSFAEGIAGETGLISDLNQWAGDLLSDISGQLNKLMADAFGNAGASVAGSAGGAGTAPSFTEQVDGLMAAFEQSTAGQILGAINMAYTAYVVATVLVNIIWECEEEELELNTQKELKNCSYVGSYCNSDVLGMCIEERETYCCFMSPLSRIIQEQARPQLGMSFGSPENLSCDGLPLDVISKIDWDRVNLDEWVGLLQITGNLPDANISMDSLTGKGSNLSLDDNRPNAIERSQKRYGEEIDVDEIRKKVTKEMEVFTGAPLTPN